MADDPKSRWNERYRQCLDDLPIPLPFFVDFVQDLPPGRALDLACGAGRHALYLAERGWQVTAIDYSDVALSLIHHPRVSTLCVDIESPCFEIPNPPYDLVIDSFFLHRPLFAQIREAVVPGGAAVFALHSSGTYAIESSELDRVYADWLNLHSVDHHQIPTLERIFRKPSNR